jgi:hypothetical protein
VIIVQKAPAITPQATPAPKFATAVVAQAALIARPQPTAQTASPITVHAKHPPDSAAENSSSVGFSSNGFCPVRFDLVADRLVCFAETGIDPSPEFRVSLVNSTALERVTSPFWSVTDISAVTSTPSSESLDLFLFSSWNATI